MVQDVKVASDMGVKDMMDEGEGEDQCRCE